MNEIERIIAIQVLNKLANREIGIRKGHKIILKEVTNDIEKQIPKKVDRVGNKCPVCKSYLASEPIGDKYCFSCGQAIDWSDPVADKLQ